MQVSRATSSPVSVATSRPITGGTGGAPQPPIDFGARSVVTGPAEYTTPVTGPLLFNAWFSEPVNGFDTAQLNITGGTVAQRVTGDGQSFNFYINPDVPNDVTVRVPPFTVTNQSDGKPNRGSNMQRCTLSPVGQPNLEYLEQLLFGGTEVPKLDGTITDERDGLGTTRDLWAGRAWSFLEGSFAFIDVPDAGGTRSWSLWIKPATLDTGGLNKGILQPRSSFGLRQIDNTVVCNLPSKVYVNGVENGVLTAAGRWHHVAVVVDTSTATDAVLIGRFSTDYWSGEMADVRFWKTYALQFSDLQNLLIHRHHAVVEPDDLGYHFKADEDNQDIAINCISNILHGTKTNWSAGRNYIGADVPVDYPNNAGHTPAVAGNIFAWSEKITETAFWVLFNGNMTQNELPGYGPNGETAFMLTPKALIDRMELRQTSPTANAPHIQSCYVEPAGMTRAKIADNSNGYLTAEFDFVAGTAIYRGIDANGTAGMEQISPNRWRIWVKSTPTESTTRGLIFGPSNEFDGSPYTNNTTGNGSDGGIFWGFQLELADGRDTPRPYQRTINYRMAYPGQMIPRDEQNPTLDLTGLALAATGRAPRNAQAIGNHRVFLTGGTDQVQNLDIPILQRAANEPYTMGCLYSQDNNGTFAFCSVRISDAGAGYYMTYLASDGKFYADYNDGSAFWRIQTKNAVVPKGTQYHLAVSHDGTGAEGVKLWVDGAAVETEIITDTGPSDITWTATEFKLSAGGLHGDVRWFDRVLSATEMESWSRGETIGDEQFALPCSEGGGTVIYDTSANRNHCQAVNVVDSTLWGTTAGRFPRNLAAGFDAVGTFDGNRAVLLANSTTINHVQNTMVFELEIRFRLDDPTVTNGLIGNSNSGSFRGFFFYFWDNQRRFNFSITNASGVQYQVASDPDSITDTNWHTVKVIGNGAGITWTLDGAPMLVNEIIPFGDLSTGNSTYDIRLGAITSSGNVPFNPLAGNIAYVKLTDGTDIVLEHEFKSNLMDSAGNWPGQWENSQGPFRTVPPGIVRSLPSNGASTLHNAAESEIDRWPVDVPVVHVPNESGKLQAFNHVNYVSPAPQVADGPLGLPYRRLEESGTGTVSSYLNNSAVAIHYARFFARARERDWVLLFNGTATGHVWFDLVNGVVGERRADVADFKATPVGRGWWDIQVLWDLPSVTGVRIYGPEANSQTAWDNVAGHGIDVAEFVAMSQRYAMDQPVADFGSDATPIRAWRFPKLSAEYVPELSDAAWGPFRGTVSDRLPGPEGFDTAYRFTDNTETGGHGFQQDFNLANAGGRFAHYRVRCKAETLRYMVVVSNNPSVSAVCDVLDPKVTSVQFPDVVYARAYPDPVDPTWTVVEMGVAKTANASRFGLFSSLDGINTTYAGTGQSLLFADPSFYVSNNPNPEFDRMLEHRLLPIAADRLIHHNAPLIGDRELSAQEFTKDT